MAKKQKSTKNAFAECPYCGRFRRLENEHILARCITGKPYPPGAPVIRSCRKCNEDKSRYDQILRDYLALDVVGSEHPRAQEILHTTLRRSIDTNRSEIWRAFRDSAEFRPFYSKGGILLGDVVQCQFDGSTILKAFEYLVRGFYYNFYKVVLPTEVKVEFNRFYPHQFSEAKELLSTIELAGPYRIGEIFDCWYNISTEDSRDSFWVFSFFNKVLIIGTVAVNQTALS